MAETRSYEIKLCDGTGTMMPATVDVRVYDRDEDGRRKRECTVRVSWRDTSVEAVEFSVYHAFASAREKMEPLGLIPQCYGSCPEVQVSGMAVDMGDGTIAYRLSRPDQGWHEPTVNIFDTASDIRPAPVADQRNYRIRGRRVVE